MRHRISTPDGSVLPNAIMVTLMAGTFTHIHILGTHISPPWAGKDVKNRRFHNGGANVKVASITDLLNHDTDLGYDDFGRRTTVTSHLGYVTTTAYNVLDQVTSVTTHDPDGAGGLSASTRIPKLYSPTDFEAPTSGPF